METNELTEAFDDIKIAKYQLESEFQHMQSMLCTGKCKKANLSKLCDCMSSLIQDLESYVQDGVEILESEEEGSNG